MIQNDQKLWLVPEIYMHAGKDLWKTIISATEIYTQAPALMTSVPNCNNNNNNNNIINFSRNL